MFLYREVLRKEIGYVDSVIRAKKSRRLPVVLTKEEVKTVLDRLSGAPWLMSMLLYGAGLRLMECCRVIRLPPTYWRTVTIFGPFKNYWGTKMSAPR